jgi:transposase
MAAKVILRVLTDEEQQAIAKLAQARTAAARLVDRARIIQSAAAGQSPGKIAAGLGCSRPTVYAWIRRFNDRGLRGLEERPRSGRPHTYTAEQRAEVLATALTDPKVLDLPFGCWTLDRLQAYLNEQKGIPIKRSRIDEILTDEGLRWRKQETWFGERVDPEFAEKRGSSRHSTRERRRAASSSASTRWAPSRPRASRDSNSSTPSHGQRPSPPRGSRTAGVKTIPLSGPSRRSTTGDAARAPSSAPSARPPARR